MTNFEKIKNMSVVDFFKLLGQEFTMIDVSYLISFYCDCGECPAIEEGCKKGCRNAVKKWLKREVQDE